jgi:hypothetical protein
VFGQDDAICDAASHAQRFGPAHAQRDGRCLPWREIQRDAVQAHMVARHGHTLPAQQRTHRGRGLLQRRELRTGEGTDLAHPCTDPVAEAGVEAPGEEARQRRQFHGGEGSVARHRRQDADADRDAFGRRQRSGYRSDSTGIEAVLHEPQFVEAGRFGGPREGDEPLRRVGAAEHDADMGCGHWA